jgi:predicted Zn-dependent protease
MSNTAGAIAEYKKALAVAPTDSMALDHLANAYWHTADWAAARDGFVALLRQDSTNCIAHWKLANALDELAESASDALAQTDMALKTCPSLAQARVERGRILLRMGQAKDALAELLIAEKSAPDESSIQILLAKTYKALGDSVHAASASARFQQLQQAEHAAEEAHAADVIGANR